VSDELPSALITTHSEATNDNRREAEMPFLQQKTLISSVRGAVQGESNEG